jgi:hypothetical protein
MSDERPDENGRTHAFTAAVMRKLRGNGERRGMSPAFVGIAITALVALGGLIVFVLAFGKDLGAQQQRIDTVEKRQVEDRTATGEKLNKVEGKVERIDANVNLILQEIRAMQAEQRAERRTAGRRDRD